MAEEDAMPLLHSALSPRGLFAQPPPPPLGRDGRNPTLLFSWWVTIFSAVIIIIRLCGRKTRSNKLFREDWIIMIALVPLFIRMAFIHVVLLYGTNNVQTIGYHYTPEEIYQRSIGSRLVLAARIFYALYIWTCKLMISEFLKRITIRIWRRSYEYTLQGIRIFLLITFCLVVIATLSECQPFDHYWQVIPDPGAHCRQGYGNLITMGTCDTITDILLVAFPIPIIIRSGQTWRRKLQLSSLFSLSIIPICITLSRVVMVIGHEGRQQYRTVWASCEILAATAVANSVIIGSFLRDKGTKKNKYRSASVSESLERASARRPTLTALQNTGSDEDLFRFLGIRVPEHLQEEVETAPRLAPAALPAHTSRKLHHHVPNAPKAAPREAGKSSGSSVDSDDSLRKQPIPEPVTASPAPSSRRAVNFFDVGGLLEDGTELSETRSRNSVAFADEIPPTSRPPGHSSTTPSTREHDFAPPNSDPPNRNGSHAFLQDIGGLLSPNAGRAASGTERFHAHRPSDSHLHRSSPRHSRVASPPPTGVLGPMLTRHETPQSLQDAGGLLLSDIPEAASLSLPPMTSTSPSSPHGRRAFSDAHPFRRPGRRRRYDCDMEDDDEEEKEEEEEDLMELTDLAGVLSESRVPEAGAATQYRQIAWGGRIPPHHPQPYPQRGAAQSASSSSGAAGGSGWESMRIEDPGDLLGK